MGTFWLISCVLLFVKSFFVRVSMVFFFKFVHFIDKYLCFQFEYNNQYLYHFEYLKTIFDKICLLVGYTGETFYMGENCSLMSLRTNLHSSLTIKKKSFLIKKKNCFI